MNVSLNPEELLHAYETLVKNPGLDNQDQEDILNKFRKPILAALENEHVKLEASLYQAWSEKSEKRIEELARENLSMKTPRVARNKR